MPFSSSEILEAGLAGNSTGVVGTLTILDVRLQSTTQNLLFVLFISGQGVERHRSKIVWVYRVRDEVWK